MSEAEDDDPVVEEISVYLSKQLTETLYLFQYPVRPSHLPYDNAVHLESRMKPKQQKVEMELAINTRTPNYARSRGEQIAINVDGNASGSSASGFFQSDVMDKQVLTSSASGVGTGRYAIGAFRNGEFHLTPLKGVVQLRPDMSFLDRSDAAKSKAELDDSANDDDYDEEAKPVRARYVARETDEAKARRMASYEFLQKRHEDEEWVRMRFHGVRDELAERRRDALFAAQSNPLSEFYMTPEEYVALATPSDEREAKTLQAPILSLGDIKRLPLGDQILALLRSAKAMRFAKLLSLLPKGTNATDALRSLQQVAVLIDGCWVVKSEHLYPKERRSAHGGVPADAMCRARDYLLCRFAQNSTVSRRDLNVVFKLPTEDEAEVLENLARRNETDGWVFALQRDAEFIARHPEVVERQARLWLAKGQQFTGLNGGDNGVVFKSCAAGPASPKSKKLSGKIRKKSSSDECLLSDRSDTDVEQQKTERSRKRSSRDVSLSENNYNDLIDEVIAKNSTSSETDGLLVPVSQIKSEHRRDAESTTTAAPSAELRLALTDFVRRQLLDASALWKSVLKLRFQKHLASLPAGHVLGRGVSDHLLEQSLVDAGARRTDSSTPNGESVFVLHRRGDGLDPVRAAILDLLNGKTSLKIGALRRRLTEDGRAETPGDAELKKALKEFCETRGGCWHLKGTVSTDQQ